MRKNESQGELEPLDTLVSRRLLDAFLVDNDELEALNARLGKFNLFRVLRVERAEIRHSNVLAWLLTPGESHGLGPSFLRRFLSRLVMENESLEIPFTAAQVELMELDDVEVRREWQNIDIVVRSGSGEWCLIIENKIGSRESPGQLSRYLEAVQKDLGQAVVIPVFLTLEGDDPSEEGKEAGYVPLSHTQILELADRIVEQNQSRIPSDAGTLLSHYLETLRRLTMEDEELVTLCKAVYRKHREAIDLIVQYGGSSQVLDSCEAAISSIVGPEYVQRTMNRVWFLPKAMAQSQRDVLAGWGVLKRRVPVLWWFHYKKKTGKLQLTMEVGPIEDSDLRIRLLKALKEADFSFWEKGAFRREAKYTRILTKGQALRKTEDGDHDDAPDYVRGVAESLWKKAWHEGEKVVNVLSKFDWAS